MPMSVSCRRSEPRVRPTVAAGFTLLELLIVLALIAIAAAVAAPRLERTYDAVAGSGERAEVRRQLESLPLRVRRDDRPLTVQAEDATALAAALSLPAGWRVVPLDVLQIEASGVCAAARVRVDGRGATEVWRLRAPDCVVSDAP